ncbi:DUF4159 domain-containing protein [Solirubrum puertoriconensis]|uniref:DUF4159 domain-containing protein n=1 Tax=Solirubrum puertoriconensis TaxID=1751427 RepID=A0A9X0L5P2_SOLP1|nr:DUF4159 domain-containing protein [Solirubrum puertoriconensis]KUG08805.1 hypothetical protein ASU33_11795 [Solirubrum puertoriconensis]
MKLIFRLVLALVLLLPVTAAGPSYSFQIARLQYGGGGDWYGNKTSLPNLIRYCNQVLKTNIAPEEATVEPGSRELLQYPFVHMTGHGNVTFTDAEAKNLRRYLTSGGFLHIDDNYGLDKYIRPEMKKVFPELEFIELPYSHPIYHQKFPFSKGLPKVHEHDGKRPQGFGLIYKGRLVCFYSYECDLGNGWEDPEVYKDPVEKHEAALRMGANLMAYAITQE